MKTNAKMMVMGLVLAMVFCYAGSSFAGTASGATSAAVDLNFRVVIANYLEFQVGDAVATNTVVFTPLVTELENNTEIASTGGDVAGGAEVTVKLVSNGSGVTITPTNNAPNGLDNGAGDYIDWNHISTYNDDGTLAAPVLNNGGGTPVNVSGPQNVDTTWRYTFTNQGGVLHNSGSYEGIVTYTATIP